MKTFLTEWAGPCGCLPECPPDMCDRKRIGGPRIKAEHWNQAQVRLEYAIAMGWVRNGTRVIGELQYECYVEQVPEFISDED